MLYLETQSYTSDHGYWSWNLFLLIWSNSFFSEAKKKQNKKSDSLLGCQVVVQSLNNFWLFATPWTAALQAFLLFTNSWSSPNSCPLKVMLSNHLIQIVCVCVCVCVCVYISIYIYIYLSIYIYIYIERERERERLLSSSHPITQSCLTLFDHMDWSTPSFPVPASPRDCSGSYALHRWWHPAISPSDTLFSFCPRSFPGSGTFPQSHLVTSNDQNPGASATALVLPVNIQGWSPLTLTVLMSLLTKGFSGIFSSTTVWRHQFFGILPSLWSSSHKPTWPLERP